MTKISKQEVMDMVASRPRITAATIAKSTGDEKADVVLILKELVEDGQIFHNNGYWWDARQIANKDPSPFGKPFLKTRNIGFFS